jgi:hypothetical protein
MGSTVPPFTVPPFTVPPFGSPAVAGAAAVAAAASGAAAHHHATALFREVNAKRGAEIAALQKELRALDASINER